MEAMQIRQKELSVRLANQEKLLKAMLDEQREHFAGLEEKLAGLLGLLREREQVQAAVAEAKSPVQDKMPEKKGLLVRLFG
jgi:hypothetical protein